MAGTRTRLQGHVLQINVAQLLKQVSGTTRQYDVTVELAHIDPELNLLAPLIGQLSLTRTPDGIMVLGKLETQMLLSCTRCLQGFAMNVSIDIEEEFRPSIDVLTGTQLERDPLIDQENWLDSQHMMDLLEIVRQNLLLAVPSSPTCQAGCLGICVICGNDRNTEPCTCAEVEVDPRWGPLLALN